MKIVVTDPPAYTPAYDRALCSALARREDDVTLVTTSFPHGDVPDAHGFEVDEHFYRLASRWRGVVRRIARALGHVPASLRLRRRLRGVDVVHHQWFPIPFVDRFVLARGQATVMTMHWRLPDPNSFIGRCYASIMRHVDAVVIHTTSGRDRLVEEFGVAADRVHVVPHGAFDYLTRLPHEAELPSQLDTSPDRVVVLAFGLIRDYKGTDLLIEAFDGLPASTELWIVGAPFTSSIDEIRAAATGDRIKLLDRFVEDDEIPAIFRRADVVCLPYRHIEQSGVLYTALAFGRPSILTDVGGFPEIGATGAAEIVPAGDVAALRNALQAVTADPERRQRMAEAASLAAATTYSWDRIADQTLDVYRTVLGQRS